MSNNNMSNNNLESVNVNISNTSEITNIFIFKNYISVPFVITFLCVTSWIFGTGNINLIRYWYFISMSFLLGIRVSEFIEIKYYHFLVEMCYYINILTMFIVILDMDVKIIYPFTHGPLLFYCIIFGDAPIPNKLTRTLTFAIHCYSALVTRNIYWIKNYNSVTNMDFSLELLQSLKIYMSWFIFYSIYLLTYNGKSNNMIKYMFRINKTNSPTLIDKIIWLVGHFIAIMITCSFGIIIKYNYWLNNFAILLLLCSSVYHIGRFYYKHN